jgi:hypothetical protein
MLLQSVFVLFVAIAQKIKTHKRREQKKFSIVNTFDALVAGATKFWLL